MTAHVTPSTVPGWLALVAARHGPSPAISAEMGDGWTYASLEQACAALRDDLRRAGVGRADRLGLVLPQDASSAVVLIGAMAACAAVPLPASTTGPEYDALLPRLPLRAILAPAGEGAAARAAAGRHAIPVIERGAPQPGGIIPLSGAAGAPVPDAAPSPGDHAVILFTSGSTGRAKLVPRTQGNVADIATRCGALQPISPDDRTILLAPLTHAYAIEQVMRVIGGGARVHLCGAFDPRRLASLLAACQPTWLSITPFMLDAWLRALDAGEATLPPPGFRFVQVSAAPVAGSLKLDAQARLGVPVLDSYGSSEALSVAYETVAAGGQPACSGVPTTGLRIVDDDGRDCPPGMAGSILVRGPNVFPGYLDDPDLTASAFTPDGWFRMGDRGFLSESGALTVLGRFDTVIVRGGEKIDPAEVEAVLLAHPGVAECVVFGEPHPGLGASVSAVVAPRNGAALTTRALRRWSLDHLSVHKTPTRFIITSDLPRTGSGKIRRADVPLLFGGASSASGGSQASPGSRSADR